jgi:hypothetical protein
MLETDVAFFVPFTDALVASEKVPLLASLNLSLPVARSLLDRYPQHRHALFPLFVRHGAYEEVAFWMEDRYLTRADLRAAEVEDDVDNLKDAARLYAMGRNAVKARALLANHMLPKEDVATSPVLQNRTVRASMKDDARRQLRAATGAVQIHTLLVAFSLDPLDEVAMLIAERVLRDQRWSFLDDCLAYFTQFISSLLLKRWFVGALELARRENYLTDDTATRFAERCPDPLLRNELLARYCEKDLSSSPISAPSVASPKQYSPVSPSSSGSFSSLAATASPMSVSVLPSMDAFLE